LQGLYSSQTLNVAVPDSWLVSGSNWLSLTIRPSELLDMERASLTISLNGLQVTSFPLSKVEVGGQRIIIPAAMFGQGNNELTFTAMLYVAADQATNCQNWDDPSRWLVIEPGGILHLSFVERELAVDLAAFPQRFIEPLEKYLPGASRTGILFVLPDDSTPDDLTSLTVTSYVLGNEAASGFDWAPEIVTESRFKVGDATSRNVIFIGKIPAVLNHVIAASDKNFIAVLPSPWGSGNVVMIIGDKDRTDGFSPAVVFDDPARRVLLRGNIAYIEDDYTPPSAPEFQEHASLEDLGYSDRTVRGIGEQDLIYRLYLPYNVDPMTATINLSLGHAPDLDTNSSSIQVYLNGFSVAGILPTARSANPAPISISLPAARLRPGVNYIRITFDLNIPYTSCERAPQSVWATVFSSSTVDLTYRIRPPVPSLKYFPLPFSDCPGAAIVIPDDYDLQDMVNVSRLSFVLGESSPLGGCSPAVVPASAFDPDTVGRPNLILVGLPADNSVIMRVNSLLPQPFTPDGMALQEGYGVLLPTADDTASLGLVQIIPSPWKDDGVLMLLTGNDAQGLGWTWDMVLDPAVRDQFAGNLMIVGSDKRSNSLDASPAGDTQVSFQQTADVSNVPVIGPLLQRSGDSALVTALVAVGAALVVTIVALVVVRAVRRRKESGANPKEQDEHE
jgi:hypothetical protein